MTKNLSFTVLLLVLVVASTGFLKREAIDCPDGCPTAVERVFLDECGPEPFTGTDLDCSKGLYASPPLCSAIVEVTNLKHCHCYKKKV